MLPTEAAYVAGFIDGEGTIGIIKARRKEARSGYRLQPHLQIANTDMGALESIQRMCGGRLIQTTSPAHPNHKPGYVLRYSPNQMRFLLPQIAPFLIIKAKQAAYVMEFLSFNVGGSHLSQQHQDRAHEIRDAVRGLNARGLPVTVQ